MHLHFYGWPRAALSLATPLAKRVGGLAVTTLPGVSRSFNPALEIHHTGPGR